MFRVLLKDCDGSIYWNEGFSETGETKQAVRSGSIRVVLTVLVHFGLPRLADILRVGRHVSNVPIGDVSTGTV